MLLSKYPSHFVEDVLSRSQLKYTNYNFVSRNKIANAVGGKQGNSGKHYGKIKEKEIKQNEDTSLASTTPNYTD